VIDGMNVIGTRPDAWWRDRHGAMVRLVKLLEQWSAATGADDVPLARAYNYPTGENGQTFQGPVPRADCGPGSTPETGQHQGEVTIADRESGRSAQPYSCNMELVDFESIEGDGARASEASEAQELRRLIAEHAARTDAEEAGRRTALAPYPLSVAAR